MGKPAGTVWATFISPHCICSWEPAEPLPDQGPDEHTGYRMTRLVRHCVVHKWVETEDDE